jgi:tetratricopeptide (TPR) repeat protein
VSVNYQKKKSEAFLVQEIYAAYREFRNSEGIKLAKLFVKKNKTNQVVWKILGEFYKRANDIPSAILAYRRAIYLIPGDASAHINLGLLLKSNNQKIDAEKNYRQALTLDPNSTLAMNNLANLLRQSGKVEEAEKLCRDALKINPKYDMALINLAIILDYQDGISERISILNNLVNSENKLINLQAMTHLAITTYLRNQFDESRDLLARSKEIQNINNSILDNEKKYHTYLSKILNDESFKNQASVYETTKKLFVIGDSHSLTSHALNINIWGETFHCEAFLIKGCKQWDLAKDGSNQFKNKLNLIFKKIPKKSNVLLSIGEIDCRLDSGIIKFKEKYPRKSMDDIIENTINRYFKYISELNKSFHHNLIFQTVPCPNLETKSVSEDDYKLLNYVIKSLNNYLKLITKELHHKYLDLHSLTDRGDGFSNNKHHIDAHHLSRQAMTEAWKTKFVNKV